MFPEFMQGGWTVWTATLAAIGVTAVVLVFFAIDTLNNAPATFIAILLIALLAVALEFVCKRMWPPLADAPAGAPGG